MHGVLLDGHVDELDCDAPRSLGAGGIRRSASPFCSDYVVAALVPRQARLRAGTFPFLSLECV